MDNNRIRQLVAPVSAHEADLEERLKVATFSVSHLSALQSERLELILSHWAKNDNIDAAAALTCIRDGEALEAFLLKHPPLRRVADQPIVLSTLPERAVRTLCTSGSSSFPMPYSVCAEWRLVHHCTWRLAYRFMTNGALQGYLDPSVQWAMARPPEGSVDNFEHQIECMPTPNGISYSHPPHLQQPSVVHGAITTMLEMLENEHIKRWRPTLVIFTYELAQAWQIALIRQYWPDASLHYEYASNDGGASAFTCSQGGLHFWSSRAWPLRYDGSLRLIDLWNTASGFINYECGDEARWSHGTDTCPCGNVQPIVDVVGRTAAFVELSSGRRLPVFNPFSAAEMKGLRAIRVHVHDGDLARVRFIRSDLEPFDRCLIERKLMALGFRRVAFVEEKQMADIRDSHRKFRTIVDLRGVM